MTPQTGKGTAQDDDAKSAEKASEWLVKTVEVGQAVSVAVLIELDANAYVRYLQGRLVSLGLLKAPVTGVATKATIKSLLDSRSDQRIAEQCLNKTLFPAV